MCPTYTYYPYGMPMATSTGAEVNRYKYSGKELETRNGLNFYDFAARLQFHTVNLFNQPDVKAGDYPWLNPYLYCAANPIANIDPTGQSYYEVDIDGYFKLIAENDDARDRIYSTMGNCSYIEVDKSFLSSVKKIPVTAHTLSYGDQKVVVQTYGNVDNLGEIHDFLTNNTDVEWTLMEMTDNTTGESISLMGTTNNSNFDCSADVMLDIALESNYTIDTDTHNHSVNIKPSDADIGILNKISERFPKAVFKIKIPGDPPKSKRYYKDSQTQTQLEGVTVYGTIPSKKNSN